MKEITLTVYAFDELSEEAQNKARNYVRSNWHDLYVWGNQNVKSLKGFSEFFNAKYGYSIDLCGPSITTIKLESYWLHSPEEEDSIPLIEFLQDNRDTIEKSCPFTGYFMDDVLLDPIRECLNNDGERDYDGYTLQDLLDESAEAWKDAYIKEWEYIYSDEGIDEMLSENMYQFFETGKFYGI